MAVALVVGVAVPVAVASGGSGTARSAAPAAARPDDVAAARACEDFSVYLADASKGQVPSAAGRQLADDAAALLGGASAAQAAGTPLPRWAPLGQDLIDAATDVVDGNAAALKKDGTAAAQACQTVPAGARTAGGFTPTS